MKKRDLIELTCISMVLQDFVESLNHWTESVILYLLSVRKKNIDNILFSLLFQYYVEY